MHKIKKKKTCTTQLDSYLKTEAKLLVQNTKKKLLDVYYLFSLDFNASKQSIKIGWLLCKVNFHRKMAEARLYVLIFFSIFDTFAPPPPPHLFFCGRGGGGGWALAFLYNFSPTRKFLSQYFLDFYTVTKVWLQITYFCCCVRDIVL